MVSSIFFKYSWSMSLNLSSKTCIYCRESEGSVTFGSREHVIPELLGSFENSPTLRGWVCNQCNGGIFNPLETRFKEDTDEGVHCQMHNFSDSHEIRVRNKNFKFSFDLGIEEKFFNDTFPLLTFKNDRWQLLFVPQIRLRGYAKDGFITLLIDKVKALPRSGKKFKKLKKLLQNFQSKDVSIFVHGEEGDMQDYEDAIELVRELGIDYKPGPKKSIPFVGDGTDKQRVVVEGDITIGFDTARVVAKIAFNYFAYCAVQSGVSDALYHDNFSRIKDYILGKNELPIKEVIIETPTYAPVLFEEHSHKVRLVGHIVTLSNENGNVVAVISFAGRMVYKILLGKLPDELSRQDFGNGHIFNIRQKEIGGLTQNPARRGSNELLNFSLFNNQ